MNSLHRTSEPNKKFLVFSPLHVDPFTAPHVIFFPVFPLLVVKTLHIAHFFECKSVHSWFSFRQQRTLFIYIFFWRTNRAHNNIYCGPETVYQSGKTDKHEKPRRILVVPGKKRSNSVAFIKFAGLASPAKVSRLVNCNKPPNHQTNAKFRRLGKACNRCHSINFVKNVKRSKPANWTNPANQGQFWFLEEIVEPSISSKCQLGQNSQTRQTHQSNKLANRKTSKPRPFLKV